MKEIKYITIYTQGGLYDSAKVEYTDGTEDPIKGFEEVCEKVREFSKQTKIISGDLLKDSKYITVEEKEKEKPKEEKNLTNIDDFVEELRRLNPGVEIKLGDSNRDSEALNRFFASVPADKLVLPEGFEYSEKNGITNKHHTKSGAYVMFRCEPLVRKEAKSTKKKKNIINEKNIMPSYFDGRIDGAMGTLLTAFTVFLLINQSGLFKGFNNTRSSTPKGNKAITQTVDTTSDLLPIGNTNVITQTVDTPIIVSNGSNFPANFDVIRQDDKKNSTLYYLVQKYLSGEMTSQMEFDNMLKIISNMCQTNMNDVTNLLEGKPFQEKKDTVEFQNLFDQGSDDNFVLTKFDHLRKLIVDYTYAVNPGGVIGEIYTYFNEFINFFYRGNVIPNGQYLIIPNNVELLAQHIVYTVYMKMLEQPINFSVRLDGEIYDQNMLRERAYAENLDLVNSMRMRVYSGENTR